MKLIIAGGREFTDYAMLCACMEAFTLVHPVTEVVWGCARGADALGKRWADEMGIPVKPFPANWREEGLSAGKSRNADMAYYADALVAFWDGKSTGTENMIKRATRLKLNPIWVFMYGH